MDWLQILQVTLDSVPPEAIELMTNAEEGSWMSNFAMIAAGLGLSSAAGFRVFIPLLVMSVAGHFSPGSVPIGEDFAWLTSWPAMLLLGTATAAEIGGYYVPWVDNLLDSIATPAALVAGTVITASAMPEMNDSLKWAFAAIAGGGSAGVVQTGTVLLRAASTATSGGLANPVVSTAEAGGSLLTAILAIVVPVIAVTILLVIAIWVLMKLFSKKDKTPPPQVAAA